MSVDDKRIREFAYQIWESEGQPHGHESRHWEMARKLAEAEALAPSKPSKRKTSTAKAVKGDKAEAKSATSGEGIVSSQPTPAKPPKPAAKSAPQPAADVAPPKPTAKSAPKPAAKAAPLPEASKPPVVKAAKPAAPKPTKKPAAAKKPSAS
jgi:hypothetical protein